MQDVLELRQHVMTEVMQICPRSLHLGFEK